MSEPTEADREKAAELMNAWDVDDGATYLDLALTIAAALADERAKARAPFLALAEDCAEWARINDMLAKTSGMDGPLFHEGLRHGWEAAAKHIRRAAEDPS